MQNTIKGAIAIVAVSAAVGCSQRPAGSSEFSAAVTAPTSPSLAASTGGTMKEALTGPAIGGVVPEGQALADMSRFADGGSTTLSVQIKKVNLPDGTVLTVALDFTPLGSITLRSGEGTLTVSLGHFGVSRDQVAVKYGSATILSGGRFN
ncbi:MAG TPA: hypothetical protein VNG89_16875 [Vicinamibacterales bacterium]|nr:hypothetical protein [Vicinamibacterales bacterium]